MSELAITQSRIAKGVWSAKLTGPADAQPNIKVTWFERVVEGVKLTPEVEGGAWSLSVPIPQDAVAEGVQTFLVTDGADGTRLADFTLVAGEALAHDLRAEVELLRAELDMLKRAFRRHCVETT